MPWLLDNPHKACDLQFRRPIVLFGYGQKSKEEQNRLHGSAARPLGLMQNILSNMESHYAKAKFLKSVKVYPKCFVGIVVDKSYRLA